MRNTTPMVVTAGKPFNRRRYNNAWYYTREIFVNGAFYGMWEDWASLWKDDWNKIKTGDLKLVQYPATER